MLHAQSNMPEYQWKLTIVERNLQPSNWFKLIPEAQEQMLWEADVLMEDLPLAHKLQLLTALETLQGCTEASLQQKIEQIFHNHSNYEVPKVLELNIKNTSLPTAV